MANLTRLPPPGLNESSAGAGDSQASLQVPIGSASCYALTSTACHDIWRELYFLAVGTVIPIGFIFNTLALLVFATCWMRNTVPGRYFIALAIADNLVLTGELLLWLNSVNSKGYRLGISIMHRMDWACQAVNWLRYGARIWSSYITVAITIERFLTVTYPLKMAAYSDPRKSTIVCTALFFVSFSVSMFAFHVLEAGMHNSLPLCVVSDTIMYHIMNIVIIGTFGELLVPSIIVFIFTLLIIRSLTKAQKQRALATRLNRVNHHRSREAQPTIALLAIAIMFIVIRLPYMVIFVIQDIAHLFIESQPGFSVYIAYKICKFLAVNNYAFNFLLFCLSGSAFRNQFVRFLRCRFSRKTAASDFTRSRSLSTERLNHFQVLRSFKGRSSSIDVLCHVSRKVSPANGQAVSVERLHNAIQPITKRSVSVGAEKLLNCQGSDMRINCLQPLGHTFRKSLKTRSLTPENLGLNGSIPYIDDMYG